MRCSAARTARWRWPAASGPGTFSINGGNYFSPDSPFGGYKQSGIGREMGTAGLEEFLESQDVRDGGRSWQMSRPLDGIRVLEVAMYGFVPVGGRRARASGAPTSSRSSTRSPATRSAGCARPALLRVEGDPNPNIEHANRGKRSIGLDMSVPEGKEVLLELAKRADVFLTSFLPGHRQKFGIDVDDIRAVNPKIIYARGSALGPRGEESEKGGYDMTAFWCRAGTAATITPPGTPGMIGPPGPAYGDTISGTNLAGGIAAALLKRERTGEPSVVDVSLLGSGLWAMGTRSR